MSKDYNLNSEIATELTNSNMKAQGRTEQTLLYKNLPLEVNNKCENIMTDDSKF